MSLRIELFVDDIDASIRFYERALGFRLIRRDRSASRGRITHV
jgi:catechol 2,3-dioxygenase-like lactoylglutathione lyase family enzyme